jgi:hypothetical protein
LVAGETLSSHVGRDRVLTVGPLVNTFMGRLIMDKIEKIEKQNVEPLHLEIEVLEERIAPSVTGTGGYEGQPGNQSNG